MIVRLIVWNFLHLTDAFLLLVLYFVRDEDALLNTQCPAKLELRWQTEVSSSIYATPLIADINRFEKEIVLA